MTAPNFKLVPYKKEDYNFIFRVKKISYETYVKHFFGEWNNEVQKEMFDKFIKESSDNIFLIKIKNKKVGFINGQIGDDCYNQGNICILPKFQNQGIGTKILKSIIESHKTMDIKLKVFKNNPARNLYERLGFQIDGETNSHYLMTKKAK